MGHLHKEARSQRWDYHCLPVGGRIPRRLSRLLCSVPCLLNPLQSEWSPISKFSSRSGLSWLNRVALVCPSLVRP